MTIFNMGRCIFRVKHLVANMVVTASLEVLREPPKPLGFCRTKTHGEGDNHNKYSQGILGSFRERDSSLGILSLSKLFLSLNSFSLIFSLSSFFLFLVEVTSDDPKMGRDSQ
jgi:hypothetical protein